MNIDPNKILGPLVIGAAATTFAVAAAVVFRAPRSNATTAQQPATLQTHEVANERFNRNLERFNASQANSVHTISKAVRALDLADASGLSQAQETAVDAFVAETAPQPEGHIYVSSSSNPDYKEILLEDHTSRPMTPEEIAQRRSGRPTTPLRDRTIEALDLANFVAEEERGINIAGPAGIIQGAPLQPQAPAPFAWIEDQPFSLDISTTRAPSTRAGLRAQAELGKAMAHLGTEHLNMDYQSWKKGAVAMHRAAAANQAWAAMIRYFSPKTIANLEGNAGGMVRTVKELKRDVQEKGLPETAQEKARAFKEKLTNIINELEEDTQKLEEQREVLRANPVQLSWVERKIAENNELLASEIALGQEYLKVVDALIEGGDEVCVNGAHFNDAIATLFETLGPEKASSAKEAFGQFVLSLENTQVVDQAESLAHDPTDSYVITTRMPPVEVREVVADALSSTVDNVGKVFQEELKFLTVVSDLENPDQYSDTYRITTADSSNAPESAEKGFMEKIATSISNLWEALKTNHGTGSSESSGSWASDDSSTSSSWNDAASTTPPRDSETAIASSDESTANESQSTEDNTSSAESAPAAETNGSWADSFNNAADTIERYGLY